MIFRNKKGFTLVEVVISSVMLFSVLSVGTLVHRMSVRVVDKINATVAVSEALPSIMETIKVDILAHNSQGQGTYGKFITYTWKSKVIRSSQDSAMPGTVRTGEQEAMLGEGGKMYSVALNNVLLDVQYEKGASKKKSSYEYKELSWAKK